jgi:beta-mannosidase
VERMPELDLLAGAAWECRGGLDGTLDGTWVAAVVPGTAAGALVDAGAPGALQRDYDSLDWWYRVRFDGPPAGAASQSWLLRCDGLATLADVWLNGEHVLHSESMWQSHSIAIDDLTDDNDIVIRFAALAPVLAQKRPRPRWKSSWLKHQNLRWIRTALLGRLNGWVSSPAPVGPWRPISLCPWPELEIIQRDVRVLVAGEPGAGGGGGPDGDGGGGGGGSVELDLLLRGLPPSTPVLARVGDEGADLAIEPAEADGAVRVHGTVRLAHVDLWWPHTHGEQPLYPLQLEIGEQVLPLGRVGFRSIEVDRDAGGFTIRCNGVPIFCRGSCWTPPDPVNLAVPVERLRGNLELARAANLNIVRLIGEGVYESPEFFDACDELGLLVWQDCMFAFYDCPDTEEFSASVHQELTQLFGSLQGRPCLAVVCGGTDNEEQAEFMGIDHQRWASSIAHELIPELLASLLPGTPYTATSPGESPLPTMADTGVAHYYGVGGYLRPLDDARRAGVRFASECLAFATPPEPLDTDWAIALARGMGHHPDWKRTVHRDAQTSWDLEDVRDFYTLAVFGTDVFDVRHRDAERANYLARATVATVFEQTLSEWRRPGSSCQGAIVFHHHDLSFGGGLGIIDSLDRPKAPWYVMRRTMAPIACLLTDEGLNGLRVHLVNDGTDVFRGELRVDLYLHGEVHSETATTEVEIPARDGITVSTALMFGSFRDLTYAHRFGNPAHDVVMVSLIDPDGLQVARSYFLPGGPTRALEPDLGLSASVARSADGQWSATVTTRRFAQWVSLEVAGFIAADSWFQLAPGETRTIDLAADGSRERPRGQVNALNCSAPTRLLVIETE